MACYLAVMTRQLIARIDDELHAQLKARAASEGRSLNDLVTEALARIVAEADEKAVLTARMRRLGLLARPDDPGPQPTRDAVIEATRGSGTAVSDALRAERERTR